MINPVVPFTRQELGVAIDNSCNPKPLRPTVVGKLRSYYTIPAFSYPNNWHGASEIVARFDYSAGSISLLNQFPITAPDGANFCPVVSWLKNQVFHRYKLWKDVGEILWLPLYAKQKIDSDKFYIEIWNTNTQSGGGLGTEDGQGLGIEGGGLFGLGLESAAFAALLLEAEIKLYSSRLIIPTRPYCDFSDVKLLDATVCVDPVFDLTHFQPILGDYYLLVSPCARQLIKGVVGDYSLGGNILQSTDGTWHYVWMLTVDGNLHLRVDPANSIPPPGSLGYFPMTYLVTRGIYKIHLKAINDDGGNVSHQFFVDGLLAPTTPGAINGVILLNQTDGLHYGFVLFPEEFGVGLRIIQTPF